MEFSVVFEDRPHIQENLIIKKKLAEGKFNIYQASSSSRNTTYALKVFPKTPSGQEHYQQEKVMTRFNHPNLIKYFPVATHQSKFFALLSEFASFGSFFDLVQNNILRSETLIRTFFHQLIEGLEYIHSQGIAHLDLKLENLMLGNDYQLKIIDFDQSQALKDNLMKSGGTVYYRAPEVLNGTCQNLASADVYAAGVILYAMLTKEFPLVETDDAEKGRVLQNGTFINNKNMFWKAKAERIGLSGSFNQDFMELINGMLESDPQKRLGIKEIKKSKWYQGEILKEKILRSEMKYKIECLSDKIF